MHAVDRLVWQIVDPTSFKRREGKIARGGGVGGRRSSVSLI